MKISLIALIASPLLAVGAAAQTQQQTQHYNAFGQPIVESPAPPTVTTNGYPDAATSQPAPAAPVSVPMQLESAVAPAELPVAKAEPANVLEITARLQIFLDQQNFGPGKIDGTPGEFTSKALSRYQQAHNLPVTGNLEDAYLLPLDSVYPIYTFYTITPEDVQRIGTVPREPKDQAKLKKMPYPSLLKFLQERFHSDPDFLRYLNRDKDMDNLVAGDVVRAPNVAPFKIEEVRAVAKLPIVPEFKTRRIRVDTKEKLLDLFEGDTLIATFPITPGSAKLPAPAGTWRILGIATLPWFRHDEGVLNHGVRTSNFFNIPAGPSNPVGVVWIGLNKPGIGLHGTNNPQTIGRAGSHGCIRIANWDAIRLAGMITQGMTVVIDDGTPKNPAEGQDSVKVSQTDR